MMMPIMAAIRSTNTIVVVAVIAPWSVKYSMITAVLIAVTSMRTLIVTRHKAVIIIAAVNLT